MPEQIAAVVGDGERKALIATCNLTAIGNKPYATHMLFAFELARQNPDFQFMLFTPYRMTIADFRNHAADAAMECGAEYLMFYDDDSIMHTFPSAFKTLLDYDKHIISPVYYVRGYPFHPMFFKNSTNPDLISIGKGLEFYDDYEEIDTDENGLLEVAAVGCHFTLMKTEIFPALERPYFLTGMNNTEDVYFCMKCRDYIENIEIYVDTKHTVGHILDPLWVDMYNVGKMRKFYKDIGMNESSDWADAFHRKDALLAEKADES